MSNIVLNRIKCNLCSDIIASYHRYDFKFCKCGSVAVDGGLTERNRSGEIKNITEMCVFDDAPFEVLRESLHWGNRGKDGRQPMTFLPVSQMSDSHIQAILATQRRAMPMALDIFNREVVYRMKNNISICE